MASNEGTGLKIVWSEPGKGTGDTRLRTEDGQWWERWDGIVRSGEEVRTKRAGHLV